jgi:hypothetical protein
VPLGTHFGETCVRIVTTSVMKNGIWLTLPPLLFSLGLMWIGPTPLTPAAFNKDVPTLLIYSENILRIVVFAMPAFLTVGIAAKTQRRGLWLYLAGVAIYCATYAIQNYLPDSTWSRSMIGFTASAYTNLIWMIGLGLMGNKFYFPQIVRYHPVYFIVPATIFIGLHVAHTILFFRLTHS